MHDKPRGAGDADGATTAALDIRDQGVVLIHVLSLSPPFLGLGELLREVGTPSADFGERDRFERAVRDLVSVGLLCRNADLVLPTRAALRFNEILAAGV
jgi:hypothetical protein